MLLHNRKNTKIVTRNVNAEISYYTFSLLRNPLWHGEVVLFGFMVYQPLLVI